MPKTTEEAAIAKLAQPTEPRTSERACADWALLIPPHEWKVYESAIRAVRGAGVRFMLGGAFGLAAYTGRWRNTKDIDFFVLPNDRDQSIRALAASGFKDYYDILPYDRGWIYRATRDGVIVDVIWGTPNRRTEVDQQWLEHARHVGVKTEAVDVVPPEELAWIKLYVLQRDRCDWPDVINLFYATSSSLDWDRLVERLDEDFPLLAGVLCVFGWLCPARVNDIPLKLRKRSGIQKPRKGSPDANPRHINLLDTRPWFAGLQPCDQPMRLG